MPGLIGNTPSISDISLFKVGENCYMTAPCKHDCSIHFADGTICNVQLHAPCILYLHDNIWESKVQNPWDKTHFAEQMPYLAESTKQWHMERLKNYVRI
ncbi:hypothetical protein [Endozoicomonas acroporae]|uniref:hypothetical protein n=1 Tax=Endozoicomonas acroporae TaxID=1701104 RepID=UPI000C78021D|nr:hypothetical protein [Endozoicomonas acroporae]